MPWPALGPMRPQVKDADLIGGHPTAAGSLDRDTTYPPLPADDTNRGSGRPGRPKYRRLAPMHGKMGGMLPGNTPNGPQQPGVDYDDGEVV
jgi:hypothetical protein